MKAWLLTALFCAPVSAATVDDAGAGRASPISVVPGASLLAPSLNTGAILKAFQMSDDGARLPAGAVRLAPPIADLAPVGPAASGAARQDAPGTSAAAQPHDPPPTSFADASGAAAAAVNGRTSDLATVRDEAGTQGRDSAEGALSFWRRIFDRAGRASASEAVSGTPRVASAVSAPIVVRAGAAPDRVASASVGSETLRDAVASPIAAAPSAALTFFRVPGASGAPARAFPASPAPGSRFFTRVSFDKLVLELGSGLVVKVRAALGLGASRAASVPVEPGAVPAPFRGAPVTSTQWLERRGLLESLSVSEAAASQTVDRTAPVPSVSSVLESAPLAAPTPLPAPSRASVPADLGRNAAPAAPAFAWWSLLFLPAAFALAKKAV